MPARWSDAAAPTLDVRAADAPVRPAPAGAAAHNGARTGRLIDQAGTPAVASLGAPASRAKQEPSHFLKVRLGRRKDHQELEVFGDVDETVLGKLGYEGD